MLHSIPVPHCDTFKDHDIMLLQYLFLQWPLYRKWVRELLPYPQ